MLRRHNPLMCLTRVWEGGWVVCSGRGFNPTQPRGIQLQLTAGTGAPRSSHITRASSGSRRQPATSTVTTPHDLPFLHKNMVQVGVVDVSVMSHVTPHRVMMIDGIDSQFFSSCCCSSVVSRKKGKRTEEGGGGESPVIRCPRDRSFVYPP